jgi:hypothetical protein
MALTTSLYLCKKIVEKHKKRATPSMMCKENAQRPASKGTASRQLQPYALHNLTYSCSRAHVNRGRCCTFHLNNAAEKGAKNAYTHTHIRIQHIHNYKLLYTAVRKFTKKPHFCFSAGVARHVCQGLALAIAAHAVSFCQQQNTHT